MAAGHIHGTDRGRPDWSRPDWHHPGGYAHLADAEPAALAWEWLRRDPDYRAAAATAGTGIAGAASSRVLLADPSAARWGLHAFEDPALQSGAARPVWRRAWLARVLDLEARLDGDADDRFDLERFAHLATVVSGSGGREHVLLSDGVASLRLDVMSGSLLAGPVRLSYRLAGLAALRGPLGTLQGLAALWRSGRLGRSGGRPRNRRLVLLLRAYDGLVEGASQRQLAAALLRPEADEPRWRAEAPSLRTRAQRLAQGARAMGEGEWRALLAN